MQLPVPEQYEDWRQFAHALLRALESDGNEQSGAVANVYHITQNLDIPELPSMPEGFRAVWLSAADAKLYLSNPDYDPPTAPDIVYIDTLKLAEAAVEVNKLADNAVTNAKIFAGAVTSLKIADLNIIQAKLALASVGTGQLITGSVTSAILADMGVTTAKLNDAVVTTGKLVDNAITTAKIDALAVTNAKLAALSVATSNIQLLAVTNPIIAGLAVDAAKLAALAVTSGKIAASAVGTTEIADAAIITAKIGLLAVNTAHLQDAAITSAKILDAAIGTADIADAQITTAKIALASITAALIEDAAITNAKIGTAAIGTANIQDGSIVTAKIGSLAVVSAKIGDLEVGTLKINDYAITSAKVLDATLVSADIGTGQILTANIGDAVVLTAKIQDGAISSAKILDATIASADIGAAQIITALIADASIVEAKIGALAVNEAKIANAAISSAKIANLAVGAAHIQLLAVGSAQIADAAITNAKIAGTIQSSSWNNSTKTGWSIDKAGNIEGRSISIYDNTGTLIFSAGGLLDYGRVTGTIRPAEYASADLKLTVIGSGAASVTTQGNKAIQTGGASLNNYTTRGDALYGPCFVEQDIIAGAEAIIALDTSSTQASFASLQVSAQYSASGSWYIYTLGTQVAGPLVAAGVTGRMRLEFDGVNVILYGGGVKRLTIAAPSAVKNVTLYPKWTLYSANVSYTGLRAGNNNDNYLGSLGGTTLTALVASGGTNLLGQFTSGNISTYIAGAAIGTALIANAAITNALIGNLAVGAANIADASISTAKIGSLAVATAHIQDLSVGTIKIAANAVNNLLATEANSRAVPYTATVGTPAEGILGTIATPTGEKVRIDFTTSAVVPLGYTPPGAGAPANAYFSLWRRQSSVDTKIRDWEIATVYTAYRLNLVLDTPAAGASVSYLVKYYFDQNGSGNLTVAKEQLVLTEVKR